MLWTNPNDNAAMINLKSTHYVYPLYNNAYYKLQEPNGITNKNTTTQRVIKYCCIFGNQLGF